MIAETLWANCGYTPHPGQVAYHESNARFKVAACGRRFGKSKMAAAEAIIEMFDTERPGRGWIVGPTYDTADEFQYMWDFIVVNMGLGPKLKKANNARSGEMYIEMPWGGRVDVKSADKPATLVGKGLKWVILSEAAKLHPIIFRKYIRPALADFRGWCSMPSTPEGFNWYKELHDRGNDPKFEGEWESWNLPSWLNLIVYPGGFEDPEIQGQLTGPDDPWFWQEIGAEFRSVVGLIYSEWSREANVKPIPYRPEWQNQLWFDYGYSNPFVALDVMIDPEDNVYIWREYYVRQKPVYAHAHELRNRAQPEGYHADWGSGDAAGPEATEVLGEILCPVIADPDSKEVSRGILEVKKFVRSPHGPRLFVNPSCVNTIHEFETYKMKEPRSVSAMENPKEEPRKYDDHSMDAIRYGIMHNFVLGANRHLEDVYDANDAIDERGIFTWGDTKAITMGAGSW